MIRKITLITTNDNRTALRFMINAGENDSYDF